MACSRAASSATLTKSRRICRPAASSTGGTASEHSAGDSAGASNEMLTNPRAQRAAANASASAAVLKAR
eukprot:scaffold8886_cov125-Isochrysis_galbana.AAC.12